MESVFNKFDDEEADEQPRKRKLVPLDYGDDDKSLGLDGAEISGAKGSINTEEKRKHIKSLIEKIPTARPELFSYPLDWTMVDSVKSGYLICNHLINIIHFIFLKRSDYISLIFYLAVGLSSSATLTFSDCFFFFCRP